MESITEKEKRFDKMSATFEELKDGILSLKNVKSEYSQAAIILLRNVFTEREQKQSEQQSNCNLPQVSNLVCPTHGTMLYKHTNGLAYCSFCTYSVSWQTGC